MIRKKSISRNWRFYILFSLIILSLLPTTYSHPGRTNSEGCHTCRTNCESWGLGNGEYHCHNADTNETSNTDTETNTEEAIEYCGDNKCNSNEDCSSCSKDCGSCQISKAEELEAKSKAKDIEIQEESVEDIKESINIEENKDDSKKIIKDDEAKVVGMTVYKSKDIKAGRSAIFFFTAALILIIIALVIALIKNEQRNQN